MASSPTLVRLLYRTLLRHAQEVQRSPAPFLLIQSFVLASTTTAYLQVTVIQEGPKPEERGVMSIVTPDHDARVLDRLLPGWLRPKVRQAALNGKELRDVVRSVFRELRGLEEESSSPTVAEALDDGLAMVRLMSDQMSLFHSTSVTDTRGIRIIATAGPAFNHPPSLQWQFHYKIRVENHSDNTVQLMSRHWVIKDSEDDVVVEVPKGAPGVVGQTPILQPGDIVQYASGTGLPTRWGYMHGDFQFVRVKDDERFDALIDPFRLGTP